ncbi:cyclin-domain-containing protein [Aspergillus cavernicola]|uniref:Cyclin-domain-containing protein n=1 Tax=Aspergillus cavernicola TaxID=176166 RepID=A0ABR4IL06_9EURO
MLSTHSYFSAPPITPTIPHDSRTDGSACVAKQHYQNTLEAPDLSWTAPFRDGLPTPPSDMNSVAYSNVPSYGGKSDGYAAPVYSKVPAYTRMNADFLNRMVKPPQLQSQPPIKEVPTREAHKQTTKDKTISTPSYLQIPPSINNGKGNLPDFAAQMTCLFWFESSSKLNAIEERSSHGASLSPEAIPSVGFQKWVSGILSTTQVSQNVILLALLFIHRLKKFNPGVRGKKGSEYRLLTIALMLGNKFLDDNTYTNKTWAEVSRISVHEIHVMEVEFLSNLRYNLYASEKEWAEWHVKLGLLADFFNNAPLASENHQALTPALRISPSLLPMTRTQLSPISSTRLPSPSAENLHPQTWAPMNGASYTAVPQISSSEVPQTSSRKRCYEEPAEQQHPPKRMALPNAMPIPSSTLPPTTHMNVPALPPMLAPTSAPPQQTVSGPVPRLPPNNLIPSVPASIPQLTAAPGRPTIPPVYNPSTWAPQIPVSTAQPLTSSMPTPAISLPDPSRHHNSPFHGTSATVSPAVSTYAAHTPQTHLSPSYFLANRYSPYRPVRTVNTLLIPPPSASFEQQRTIPFDHMHYQPLGKSFAERKSGLLPYLHHEAWPQGPYIPPSFHTTPHYAS